MRAADKRRLLYCRDPTSYCQTTFAVGLNIFQLAFVFACRDLYILKLSLISSRNPVIAGVIVSDTRLLTSALRDDEITGACTVQY